MLERRRDGSRTSREREKRNLPKRFNDHGIEIERENVDGVVVIFEETSAEIL